MRMRTRLKEAGEGKKNRNEELCVRGSKLASGLQIYISKILINLAWSTFIRSTTVPGHVAMFVVMLNQWRLLHGDPSG